MRYFIAWRCGCYVSGLLWYYPLSHYRQQTEFTQLLTVLRLLGGSSRERARLCSHQSPSCFLGPCHPGKNSPAWRPGGPRSKDPGMHPPPGQTGCPELGPGREGSGKRHKSGQETYRDDYLCISPLYPTALRCICTCNVHLRGCLKHLCSVASLYCTVPPACCCPGWTLKPPPFSFARTTRWADTAVVML